MKRLAALALVLLAGPAFAESGKWYLLTQSEDGTVSVVSGLTKEVCEEMRKSLDPVTQHCGESPKECNWRGSPGDIKMSKCFN